MLNIGPYVEYKSSIYIIVDIIGDKAKIFKPKNKKLFVNQVNLTVTRLTPAKQVYFKGTDYLVTVKGLIINLKTGRQMNWTEGNTNRELILLLAS